MPPLSCLWLQMDGTSREDTYCEMGLQLSCTKKVNNERRLEGFVIHIQGCQFKNFMCKRENGLEQVENLNLAITQIDHAHQIADCSIILHSTVVERVNTDIDYFEIEIMSHFLSLFYYC